MLFLQTFCVQPSGNILRLDIFCFCAMPSHVKHVGQLVLLFLLGVVLCTCAMPKLFSAIFSVEVYLFSGTF